MSWWGTQAAAACIALLIAAVGIYIAFPSSAFLRPLAMAYHEDGSRMFVRETPLGSVRARWETDVHVLGTGRVCVVDRFHLFESVEGNSEMIQPHPLLRACTQSERPLAIRHRFTAYAWGIVPLRPVELTLTLR